MWLFLKSLGVLSTLPTQIGNLDAITETALLACDVKGDDKRARSFAFAGLIVSVALLRSCKLVIENAEQLIVRAPRAKEIKIIGRVCRATKKS